jgi:hypothetical protein
MQTAEGSAIIMQCARRRWIHGHGICVGHIVAHGKQKKKGKTMLQRRALFRLCVGAVSHP